MKPFIQPAKTAMPSSSTLLGDQGSLSLDVFDTTLSRVWAKPSDLFLALGRALKARGLCADADAAAALRSAVELELRQASPSGECRIGDIHKALLQRLGQPAGRADETAAIEMELELESIGLIEPVAARGRDWSMQGGNLVYVSDTYLTAHQVRALLDRAGAPVGRMFASSDLDASKRRGTIFTKVASELGAPPMLHIGDKRAADVVAAEAAGWRAELFDASRPCSRELLLAAATFSDPLAASAAGGAAKLARLSCKEPQHAGIAAIGANVAGPVFTAFAAWCVERAAAQNVERLLFLARDGQIVHRLARSLPADHGVGLVYAYGSRQALYLPAILAVGDAAWSWLEAKAHEVGAADFSKRFGLAHHPVVIEQMRLAGLPTDRPMGKSMGDKAMTLFRAEPIASLVLVEAAERRMAATAYFRSVIGAAKSVAIVDLGWKGRLQLCIATILGSDPELAHVKLKGYYFSLLPSSQILKAKQAEIFVGHGNIFNPNVVEVLASADHGSLRGYRLDDAATPVPDFDAHDPEAQALGVSAMQDAAVKFAERFLDAARIGAFDRRLALFELKDAAIACLKHFVGNPSAQDAEALGRFAMSHDTGHAGSQDLAPLVSRRGILSLALTGKAADRAPYWPQGSVARSRPGVMVSRLALSMVSARQRISESRERLRRAARKLRPR
jgi:predicted HAD superfamily hydrolase